jgi:erythromycin esterase-like protein
VSPAVRPGARIGAVAFGSPGRMSELRRAARPIEDLCDLVGDAALVLPGEASHGTHELYALRAELTRRLIGRGGVGAIAVEADWPLPRASTATCSGAETTRRPSRPSATSCASRAGCGATG